MAVARGLPPRHLQKWACGEGAGPLQALLPPFISRNHIAVLESLAGPGSDLLVHPWDSAMSGCSLVSLAKGR